jgi:hypothetical protein
LNDDQVKDLLKGINYLQKAPTKEEYGNRCRKLIYGTIEYEDKARSIKTEDFPDKLVDYAYNNMFMRTQVGGNYRALQEPISDEEGRKASHAARRLDFNRRTKSMEAAFDKFSTSDTGGLSQDQSAQRIRFLERISKANVCYFQKNVERHCGPEANSGLEKIRTEFQEYRDKICQAKISCGTLDNHTPPIPEEDLQNINEITRALSGLIAKTAVKDVPTLETDPKLAEFTTVLNVIKDKIA